MQIPFETNTDHVWTVFVISVVAVIMRRFHAVGE